MKGHERRRGENGGKVRNLSEPTSRLGLMPAPRWLRCTSKYCTLSAKIIIFGQPFDLKNAVFKTHFVSFMLVE